MMAFVAAEAQSTSPRFGTKKNEDNTYRVLTAGYFIPAQTATITLTPARFNNIIALPSMTLSPVVNFTNTAAYVGDNVTIISGASAATRTVTLGGNVVTTASTYTIGSGKQAVITFIFDGVNYLEKSRSIQP